ncbi:MAG: tRNA threonylcarbamoyladenosine dehydratase [Kiritimatiellia bacterium]
MSRFARLELLIGPGGLERLCRARVTVVGIGAVGSYAVEGLARAGVGSLRLVDFDEIRLSNINRQLYALDSTLGLPKVDVAAARVADINPRCSVEPLRLFVDARTAPTVLDPSPDVLIDAIDSLSPKVELLTAAHRLGIRTISVMGAALRTDPSLVRVADLAETHSCPLARCVRKRLAKRGIQRGILCVFSTEPVPTQGPHKLIREEEETCVRGRPRRPLGSLSTLPGVCGLWAATEAIRMLVLLRQG